MSFDGERGAIPHQQVELSKELAQLTQDYIKRGESITVDNGGVVSTVAEIKAKGLLDIENIKVNRKAKRPKA